MINIDNYEIWFLDYLEDNLSDEQCSLLIQFVNKHPDLKAELDNMSIPTLNAHHSSDTYPNKKNLLQSLTLTNDFEDVIIAKNEGDLTANEIGNLKNHLNQNPNLQNTSAYISASYLEPDNNIIFTHKDNTYQDQYSLDEMDTLVLSYMDQTISPSDKKWLEKHLSPQGLQKQINSFHNVTLIPNNDITYNFKSNLKKEVAINQDKNVNWKKYLAFAALFLGLLYVSAIWKPSMNTANPKQITTDINNLKHSPKTNNNITNKIKSQTIINPIKTEQQTNELAKTQTTSTDLNPKRNQTTVVSLSKGKTTKSKRDIVYNTATSIIPQSAIKSTRTYNPIGNTITSNNNHTSKSSILPINSVIQLTSISKYKQTIAKNDQLIIPQLSIISIQNIASIDDHIDQLPSITLVVDAPSNTKTINKVIKITKEEDGTGSVKLGKLSIEIPEIILVGISAISSTQQVYEAGKKENKNIFSLILGKFSIYRSKSREKD